MPVCSAHCALRVRKDVRQRSAAAAETGKRDPVKTFDESAAAAAGSGRAAIGLAVVRAHHGPVCARDDGASLVLGVEPADDGEVRAAMAVVRLRAAVPIAGGARRVAIDVRADRSAR